MLALGQAAWKRTEYGLGLRSNPCSPLLQLQGSAQVKDEGLEKKLRLVFAGCSVSPSGQKGHLLSERLYDSRFEDPQGGA